MPPRRRRRGAPPRPPGWPLRYWLTLATTADTKYEFRVYRRMKVWKLKQVLQYFIAEKDDYPLETMTVVYGGMVMKNDEMLRDHRVTDMGYGMVLMGYTRGWPEDADYDLEYYDHDPRDVETFLATHGPEMVEYLDMGPEPDEDPPMEISKDLLRYWVGQGVDMSTKNIVLKPGKREKIRLDKLTATYLPAPTHTPGMKLEVKQPFYYSFHYLNPLEMQGDVVPTEPLVDRYKPIDFEQIVDLLMGTIGKKLERNVVERVLEESNFQMAEAANELIYLVGESRIPQDNSRPIDTSSVPHSQSEMPSSPPPDTYEMSSPPPHVTSVTAPTAPLDPSEIKSKPEEEDKSKLAPELTKFQNIQIEELMRKNEIKRDEATRIYLECGKDYKAAREKLYGRKLKDMD